MTSALFTTWSGRVLPEWVDYNGHLNDAYYMVAFSAATDGFMQAIGLGEEARQRNGFSLYTLEVHLNYLQELRLDELIEVRTQLLAFDGKRLRLFHTLHKQSTNTLDNQDKPYASNEQVLLHVNMHEHKSAPFQPQVLEQLHALAQQQKTLAWPVNAGRAITAPTP